MEDSRWSHGNTRRGWTDPVEKDDVLQRIEGLQTRIPQFDDFLRKINEQYIAAKEDILNLKLEYEDKIEHSRANTTSLQGLKTKLAEADEIIINLRAEKSRLEQMVQAKEEKLKNKGKMIEEMEEEQRKSNEEITNLRTRLSQVMGNKLTDNNPAITDLSDRNRPSKLGEKFSELYDNAWTDAYEEIQKSCDEKETIKKLLQILMYVNARCRDFWKEYSDNLQRAFKAGSRIQMPDFILKQMRDFSRNLAPELVEHIYKQLKSKWYDYSTNSYVHSETCDSFVRGCVECCWLMAAQDPPVTIDTKERRFEAFDPNLFRPYTKTGDKLDYVVWPPLYLHADGPLLCKGVAQAVKTERPKSAPTAHKEASTRANGNEVLMKNTLRLSEKRNKNMDSSIQSFATSRASPVSAGELNFSELNSERKTQDQNPSDQLKSADISTPQTNYHQTMVKQTQTSSNDPNTPGFPNWNRTRFPTDKELRAFTYYTNRNLYEHEIRQQMGEYAFNLCRDYTAYLARFQEGWT